MGHKQRKIPKQPLPFGAREPRLIHECLSRLVGVVNPNLGEEEVVERKSVGNFL